MKKIHFRNQQTLAQLAEVRGVGYFTGANIVVRFVPAPPGTGIIFVRTDLKPTMQIPARLDQVTGTARRTTLGHLPRNITMVEHVLAALAGLRIDNCRVEVDAPEPPGLDGSAKALVQALREAGTRMQPVPKAVWVVDKPILVEHEGAALAIYPPKQEEFRISYLLNYGSKSPIIPQRHTQIITPQSFANSLADSRTYLLEQEAQELKKQGIGKRSNASDLVVFGPNGPLDNKLRYADEPARHKALDIVGDLSLVGHDIRGHVVACRSGHPLNIELGKQILKQIESHQPSCKKAA